MNEQNISDLIDEAVRLGAKLAEAAKLAGHAGTMEVTAYGGQAGRGIRVAIHGVPRSAFNDLTRDQPNTVERGLVHSGGRSLYDMAIVHRGPLTLALFSEPYAAAASEAA